MFTSDLEWKARIYGVLRKRTGVSRVSGKQVAEEIADLMRPKRIGKISLAEMILLSEEQEEDPFLQAERRLTRLILLIAVVQLLGLFIAVLVLGA